MADGKNDGFAGILSPEFGSANSISRRERRCLAALFNVLSRIQKGYEPAQMERLCRRFLSVSGVLESGVSLLENEGVWGRDAQLMAMIPSLARYSMRTEIGAHPQLDTLARAENYLKSLYIGVQIEEFHVLCLDSCGILIQNVLLQKGTIDETPFYLPHLLKAAIDARACAIVLVHNHPGGTQRPSNADIECTKEALNALHTLGIPMLDHAIVAAGKAISLRQNGWIPRPMWSRQDEFTKLNRRWLKE